MTEKRRRAVKVTDEQFQLLFDNYPDDPELIACACRDALHSIHFPQRTGVWPRFGARVYVDDGFMGSGYLLVHWDDTHKVPMCQSNGYCTHPDFQYAAITWDDQPERKHALSVYETLLNWSR